VRQSTGDPERGAVFPGDLAGMIARAFFDDPLHAWFFPDPRRRIRRIAMMYGIMMRFYGTVTRTSARNEGVAIWDDAEVESPRARIGLVEGLRLAVRFIGGCGGRSLFRMIRYQLWAMPLHARSMDGKKHRYLALIAVDPREQGKGHARRLLEPAIAEADRAGMACCLETQNPSNVPLFEHFGFRVLARLKCRGPLWGIGSRPGNAVMASNRMSCQNHENVLP
jgi:GNAT superfamily N-acetyltransferase